MFHVPENARVTSGPMKSDASFGNNWLFFIMPKRKGPVFKIIASDGMGWEHVSVSIPIGKRCPTWEEMTYVKTMFWDPKDAVMQLHPPQSEYVNQHPYCLHLWRPIDALSEHYGIGEINLIKSGQYRRCAIRFLNRLN